MEIIEILSCYGCQRIVDQFTMGTKCPRCHSKYFKTVHPSKWILFKWFIYNPKHVLKLIATDIREKYYEARSKHSNTNSSSS